MAIELVNSTLDLATGQVLSQSFAIPATTNGNFLVVTVANWGNTTVTVTDNKVGGSSSYVTSSNLRKGHYETYIQLFYLPNCAAGITQITVSFAAAVYSSVWVGEYSGVAISNPLDQAVRYTDIYQSTFSINATTTQDNELIIGFFAPEQDVTFTAGNGYTLRANQDNFNSQSFFVIDKIATTAGLEVINGTSSYPVNYSVVGATFKAEPIQSNQYYETMSGGLYSSGAATDSFVEYETVINYPYRLSITNPGAETGDTTGWTNTTGILQAVTNDLTLYPNSGNYFFFSGTTSSIETYQDITLPNDVLTDIDGANYAAILSGYHSGSSDTDTGALKLEFYGASNNLLGSALTEQYHDETWTKRTLTAPIIPNTRVIRIILLGVKVSGTNLNSNWDDLDLKINKFVALSVTNPGAESGNTTGWTNTTGTLQVSTNGAGNTPRTGSYFFFAGTTATTEAYQEVSFTSEVLTDLSNHTLGILFDGYQGGFDSTDGGYLGIEFYDVGNVKIGSTVTIVRKNYSSPTWNYRGLYTTIPSNATKARLILYGVRSLGTNLDCYWDDLAVKVFNVDDYSEYEEIMSGGLCNSGITLVQKNQYEDMSGGLYSSGHAITDTFYEYETIFGGLYTSGSAIRNYINYEIMSGGLYTSGSVIRNYINYEIMSGGLCVSGNVVYQIDSAFFYTCIGEGSIRVGNHSIYSINYNFYPAFAIGSFAYSKKKAMNGVYEKICIKDIIYHDITQIVKNQISPLYLDTLNGLWNEDELVNQEQATYLIKQAIIQNNILEEEMIFN